MRLCNAGIDLRGRARPAMTDADDVGACGESLARCKHRHVGFRHGSRRRELAERFAHPGLPEGEVGRKGGRKEGNDDSPRAPEPWLFTDTLSACTPERFTKLRRNHAPPKKRSQISATLVTR